MAGVIISALVVFCVFRLAGRVRREVARRRLSSGRGMRPSELLPAALAVFDRPRVPPPPRMMMLPRELPAAVLAVLAGRRTRARLRLIVAMRREQSLDRYYERLGRLHPVESAAPARVKTPNPAEDPAGAVVASIVIMFSVPPPDMAAPAAPADCQVFADEAAAGMHRRRVAEAAMGARRSDSRQGRRW